MEQRGYINKGQFSRVGDCINDLRRQGLLPVDFTREDGERMFEGVNSPDSYNIKKLVQRNFEDVLEGGRFYEADYWKDEEYYIQCIVEKVDVKDLFEEACREYHIPIANARGWSSINQRAEYARRFKEAEDDGKQCVLLYCGDHDPDGLRISDTLRANLEQIKDITWSDGTRGYDPANLIIDRFGLEYDFIIDNGFTWIDNLITGGVKNSKSLDLRDETHPNHSLPYVQSYLQKVGPRKCEANVLVVSPDAADGLIRDAIAKYIDEGFKDRCKAKEDKIERRYQRALDETGGREFIEKILEQDFDTDEEEDEDDKELF
jgi:hypothetical protein